MDRVHLQYGYDRNSNRLWRENPVASGFSSPQDQLYAYDPINRLVNMQRGTLNGGHTAVSPLTFEQQWGLDAVGNWNTFDQDSSGGGFDLEQTRTHNKVNEITDIAETTGPSWPTPGYDAAGNTNDFPQPNDPTARYQAVYDAWNRLVRLTDPATGDTIAEYQYDGLNRRTIKTPYVSNVAQDPEHQYYTANWQLIETRRGESTTPESQYVWGVRYIDDLILRDRDTDESGSFDERLYALQDANYNVSAVIDTSGDVQERYEYDAYGTVSYFSDDYTPRSSSNYNWTITYCAYRLDPDTGLYLVRNRTYHMALGRWLQRDPLGYVDGMGLYEYCVSCPIGYIDAIGTTSTSWKIGAVRGTIQVTGSAKAGGLITLNLFGKPHKVVVDAKVLLRGHGLSIPFSLPPSTGGTIGKCKCRTLTCKNLSALIMITKWHGAIGLRGDLLDSFVKEYAPQIVDAEKTYVRIEDISGSGDFSVDGGIEVTQWDCDKGGDFNLNQWIREYAQMLGDTFGPSIIAVLERSHIALSVPSEFSLHIQINLDGCELFWKS
ncbi:MAG: hypothetical protein GC162_17530 [Planctomycetes bacterium]|nr:hypothetical protein [Planctomycetota bacterium]